MGGAVAAIEAGYMQDEIEQAAYAYTKAVDAGEKVIVGVNRFVDDDPEPAEVFPIDPGPAGPPDRAGAAHPGRARPGRRSTPPWPTWPPPPGAPTTCCRPMREALRRRATLGEVSDVLRAEFGVYQPSR